MVAGCRLCVRYLFDSEEGSAGPEQGHEEALVFVIILAHQRSFGSV